MSRDEHGLLTYAWRMHLLWMRLHIAYFKPSRRIRGRKVQQQKMLDELMKMAEHGIRNEGYQAITNWFDEQKVASTDREQVIEQACLYLASADMPDLGSLGAYLPDIPLDEVIRLFRPAHIENDGNRSVARFAEWLALWTLHGVLDDRVRTRALDLALDERPQS